MKSRFVVHSAWSNILEPNRHIFTKNNTLRSILQTRGNMVTGGDVVERLEKRTVEAEEAISLLKSQLLFLQKTAGTVDITLKNLVSMSRTL